MGEYIVTYQLYNEHGKPIGIGHKANVKASTGQEARVKYTAMLEKRIPTNNTTYYEILEVITQEQHLKDLTPK